jgi:voltage-gated sodium channel
VYGDKFPQWFGSMGESTFTLFQIMTLESWSSGIARPILEEMPYAWVFFVPFILIATYVTLNIFIAIVVNTMNELHIAENLQREQTILERKERERLVLLAKIETLTDKLDRIEAKLNGQERG